MILHFSVQNFRSFKHRQVALMGSVGKIKEHVENVMLVDTRYQALSSALIYGKNSAGKTNFLSAIRLLKDLILNSANFKSTQKIYYYEPFAFNEETLAHPIELEISFVAKKKLKYFYKVGFNDEEILYEALLFYPHSIPAKLFAREKGSPITYGTYLRGDKKMVEKELLPNQLFLSKAAKGNMDHLNEVLAYFEVMTPFVINNANSHEQMLDLFTSIVYKSNVPYFNENLLALLMAADKNIVDFSIEERDYKSYRQLFGKLPTELRPKFKEYKINVFHRHFDGPKETSVKAFDLENESQGTQQLFLLSAIVLVNLYLGGVVIIDDVDKNLQAFLAKQLIHLFHNPLNNPNHAQLIFSSHDTAFLDKNTFRRDQIFFVEKDFEGSTKLFKLSDIKGIRKDAAFDKLYLSGHFGAMTLNNETQFRTDRPEEN